MVRSPLWSGRKRLHDFLCFDEGISLNSSWPSSFVDDRDRHHYGQTFAVISAMTLCGPQSDPARDGLHEADLSGVLRRVL
jgi:hypothetical protein